jgi:hypothetical protein
MILESLDLIAITIALSTSIIVIVLSVRQNMLLQRENMNLRRLLRQEKGKECHSILTSMLCMQPNAASIAVKGH